MSGARPGNGWAPCAVDNIEEEDMIGGFQAVADALNGAYTWPDGRKFSRQNIEAWHRRRTLNQAGQLPPSAVDVPYQAAGSGRPPSYQFDTGHWVDWARHGVPGHRNHGWVVPEARQPTAPDVDSYTPGLV